MKTFSSVRCCMSTMLFHPLRQVVGRHVIDPFRSKGSYEFIDLALCHFQAAYYFINGVTGVLSYFRKQKRHEGIAAPFSFLHRGDVSHVADIVLHKNKFLKAVKSLIPCSFGRFHLIFPTLRPHP